MAVLLSESGERLCEALAGRVRDKRVLAAMRRVAREDFVDSSMLGRADSDVALPIGHAQTTSSPFVIARMLEMALAGARPPARLLEIGGGCGYQTAVLAEWGAAVVSIERIGALAAAAKRRLRRLGYKTPRVMHGDGCAGHAAGAPYDAVIICAESARVPAALLAQLAPAGRLVLPLRKKDAVHLVALDAAGDIIARREEVRFVPMLEGVE